MSTTDTAAVKFGISSRPLQIVPYAEKTKKWFEANVDFHIKRSNFNFGNAASDRKDLRVLYQVYNNEFPTSWFDHITNPLNSTDPKYSKFPAKLRPLNMLRTNIDLLLGEYPRRPFIYNVENLGDTGYNRFTDGMKSTAQSNLTQHFVQAAMQAAQDGGQQMSPEQLQQLQQNPPLPEQVKAEFQASYKDVKAIKGQKWLRRIIREQEIRRKLHRMFKDWLIAGQCYSYKSIENDRFVYRKLSPLNIDYDKSEDQDFIEDGEWVVHREFLSPSDVTDRFYPVLDEQQNKDLELKPFMRTPTDFSAHVTGSSGHDALTGKIPVYHVQWKGKKKIGFLTYFDMETFQMVEDVVDEDYIINREKGEQVEWRWVNEVYEGWRITDNIYVGLQANPYQRNQMNNHSTCKLSYNGRKYSDTHSTNISVLEIGLPYNIMYIIVGYILEKTIAKSKGKILFMDLNAVPDNEDWTEEKFFYYSEALGYALIDRNQTGVDKTWNQYHVLDMSLFDQIKQLIELQAHFKQEWDDIIGINRQRKGQTYASDGQGVNERAAFQSTVITDMIFIGFEEFYQRELQGIMDFGKFATARGTYGTWNNDDYGTSLVEIEPEDLANEDLGVFVESASDALDKLQRMERFCESMIQNGHKASSVLEIIDAINVAELKAKLLEIEEIDAQIAQQQQQSDQQTKVDIQKSKEDFVKFSKLLDLEFMHEEYGEKQDLEYIKGSFSTFTFQNGDSNANGVPDTMEVEKMMAEKNKFMLEWQDKSAKREQKSREIDMKKKELEHNMQMDRENLKLGKAKVVTDRIKAKQKPKTKQ